MTEASRILNLNDDEIEAASMEAYQAVDDKFGKDIVMLDIREISIITDFFIITTANTQSQIKAIADEAEKRLLKYGIRMLHSEGMNSGGWVLLDFGVIIIHLFNKDEREFYNIERVWRDAKNVTPDQ